MTDKGIGAMVPASRLPKITWWDLCPFLLGAYPSITFWASNLGQIRPSEILRPFIGSMAISLVVFLILMLVVRDSSRAALATTLIVLPALSYGQLYDGLKLAGLSGAAIVRHRYLLPGLAALVSLGLSVIVRLHSTKTWTSALTVVGFAALAFPVTRIGSFFIQTIQPPDESSAPAPRCDLHGTGSRPDIYLIVLDGYERDDVLLLERGYDNSVFLKGLEELGFYVARGSLSNYSHTQLSLASLLNFEYVQQFPVIYSIPADELWPITQKVTDNAVREELTCFGYKTVAFETGIFWTEWENADYFLRRGQQRRGDLTFLGSLSRAEILFLDTTVARVALDAWKQLEEGQRPEVVDDASDHRDRIRFVFEQLERVPSLPSPKFVFAHIVSPHPPYVFGPNGELISESTLEEKRSAEMGMDAYSGQLTYLNRLVLDVVRSILLSSTEDPVIVIMGDHGWAETTAEVQLSILNAYHMPSGWTEDLYPTVTPVNTFRLVLARLSGREMSLLPDRSYYSTQERKFKFQEVPNTWGQ